MSDAVTLTLLLFVAALLYTSVGHAGASGYLAAMAFYGLAPAQMRPTALILNLVASTLATTRFRSAGHFDRRLFLILAVGSVPMAFVGGKLMLPAAVYRPVLAAALLIAAARLAWPLAAATAPPRRMPVWAGVALGLGIGLLAGLTGVGGGIYLTPVLLFAGWAQTKTAAGVSAAFILVNSAAGLAGRLTESPYLSPHLPVWAAVVLIGSLIGSTLGSRVFGSTTLRRILSVVLASASVKLIIG
ncbi:MAG TPA: sulfite exporter TauE/SafE family protein [Fimbriiglobus sp.]|nr:sulfite exporter TauE/SafE family protein [Fimbriiglobus sp.]